MKRWHHVVVAVVVPGAALYYFARLVCRKFSEWREEGDPKLARIAREYACRQDFMAESDVVRGATVYKSAVGL